MEASDWAREAAQRRLANGRRPSGRKEVASAGLRGEGGRWRRLMIGLHGKQGGRKGKAKIGRGDIYI